jgi:hypothetical protein
MPFTINPESGEEIYLFREFRGSHQHVFAIGVTNQAFYVPVQKKLTLQRDSWHFKRVPLSDVKQVRLSKQRYLPLLLLAGIMFLFGAVTSVLMMWQNLHPFPGEPIRGSGWPIALAVGGVIIPFISRGRRILTIETRDGKYKWKPQLAVDKKTRSFCSRIQDEVMQASIRAGVPILDATEGQSMRR